MKNFTRNESSNSSESLEYCSLFWLSWKFNIPKSYNTSLALVKPVYLIKRLTRKYSYDWRWIRKFFLPFSLQRINNNLVERIFNFEFELIINCINLWQWKCNDREKKENLRFYLFLNVCSSLKSSSLIFGKINCRENFRIILFDWQIDIRSWRTDNKPSGIVGFS